MKYLFLLALAAVGFSSTQAHAFSTKLNFKTDDIVFYAVEGGNEIYLDRKLDITQQSATPIELKAYEAEKKCSEVTNWEGNKTCATDVTQLQPEAKNYVEGRAAQVLSSFFADGRGIRLYNQYFDALCKYNRLFNTTIHARVQVNFDYTNNFIKPTRVNSGRVDWKDLSWGKVPASYVSTAYQNVWYCPAKQK